MRYILLIKPLSCWWWWWQSWLRRQAGKERVEELWVRVPVKTKSLSEKGGAVVMNVLGLEKVELEGFLQ